MIEARRSGAVCALVLALAAPAAALEVPYLAARVTDEADLLSPDAEARIEAELERLESATGAQVAVLTIPALGDEPLEDYSLRVVETWKLGRENLDDGALLLIVRDDRKMRLEVGYGLEPSLTDLASRRILDDVVRPHFRSGDFAGGIEAGVLAIGGIIEGREDALPPPAESGGADLPLIPRLGIFAFFLLVVGIFSLTAVSTRGCGAWMLYLFLLPFWISFPAAIIGPAAGGVLGLAWALGFPILWALLHKTRRGSRYRKSSPWLTSLGRSGGWSSGGGGFSGGGFSGGGGSFGGGGASSSW